MNAQPLSFDALLPPVMAQKAEDAGVAKANLGFWQMFALAVLAGAFVALGAVFATTVTSGGSVLPFGVVKLLGGLVFCLGLILVVVAGAELFTGNNLIVMAWASGKVSSGRLLRNWAIVYLGNFAGSILTAYMMFLSEQYTFGYSALSAYCERGLLNGEGREQEAGIIEWFSELHRHLTAPNKHQRGKSIVGCAGHGVARWLARVVAAWMVPFRFTIED